MSALAAGRRLLHLLPGLELCLRSRALILLSPSRADGMARCWREPPRRKLVTCRKGAFEEGNAARDKAVLIPDELTGRCKDANGRALDLEPIGKNSANESVQFSFEEEESDNVVCEISESLVRDVEKAAIELLAASMNWVSSINEQSADHTYKCTCLKSEPGAEPGFEDSGGTEQSKVEMIAMPYGFSHI